MPTDLHDLKIDRDRKRPAAASKWATRWIVAGVALLVLLGLGRVVYNTLASRPRFKSCACRPRAQAAIRVLWC